MVEIGSRWHFNARHLGGSDLGEGVVRRIIVWADGNTSIEFLHDRSLANGPVRTYPLFYFGTRLREVK
jgi:hypothetical protein